MNTSLDLSGKIDRYLVELCTALDLIATATGVQFLVVGATARDLILRDGYGIATARATKDVDFGIRVGSWSDYSRLRTRLIESGKFSQGKPAHRLQFLGAMQVDVVPFGAIAEPSGEIRWPEDPDTRLNVLGFDEAFRTAIAVTLSVDPRIEIRVASPLGLVLMKFIAWADRRQDGSKDARDLRLLIRNYLVFLGNNERLQDEHPDLAQSPNFEFELTGARLLGRDLRRIASPESLKVLLGILDLQVNGKSGYTLAAAGADSPEEIGETADFLRVLYHEVKGSVGPR